MLCSVYTTIAGEYCDPPFCTPISIIIASYTVLAPTYCGIPRDIIPGTMYLIQHSISILQYSMLVCWYAGMIGGVPSRY